MTFWLTVSFIQKCKHHANFGYIWFADFIDWRDSVVSVTIGLWRKGMPSTPVTEHIMS